MKKCYFPGLISLWLLPVLCLVYLQNQKAFRQYYMLPVFRITQDSYEPAHSTTIMFLRPPDRANDTVTLSGNYTNDRAFLHHAQTKLRKIVSEGDTIRAVYFQFKNTARYWSFVEALNICKKEQVLNFITLSNDIQAYYVAPIPKDSLSTIVPFKFCGIYSSISKEETPMPLVTFIQTYLEYFLIGFLFVVLVGIPAFTRLREIW